ncbi:MAG: ergothioneine biosynthesis protein EgtB [Pseudomonadota bacterium]
MAPSPPTNLRPRDAQANVNLDDLTRRLVETRALSMELASPLSSEDMVVQSMEDASPTKWHLAHVTWFFETFVLQAHAPGYQLFDERFPFCFNSYYVQAGPRHPRPARGLLTRPSLDAVMAYRAHVDEALDRFMGSSAVNAEAAMLVELGINHEQQHQELLLTDILHAFSLGPLKPAYREPRGLAAQPITPDVTMIDLDGGLHRIGHEGAGFAYDNEGPAHRCQLEPFAIANRLVTNRDWLAFMADGGYTTPTLWLSDGWACAQTNGWQAPLYWELREERWWHMTLEGLVPVDPATPVTHISYYEADAYARWAGKRLPREQEWEVAARLPGASDEGNTLATRALRPVAFDAARADATTVPQQMLGDVWEWTQSAYLPYPGYKAALGAVGEYNGKFMCNQMVMRGASCATAPGHARASYRTFFYPHQRWQFMGLRLAEDR